MNVFTKQRRNLVPNPRAQVDIEGWRNVERYDFVPPNLSNGEVLLPGDAEWCFYVKNASKGGWTISDYWDLPTGVGSGDYLWVQFDAYVASGPDPDHKLNFNDLHLWASLYFKDDDGDRMVDWVAWCHDEEAPFFEFKNYIGLVKIPPTDVTKFALYIKTDELVEGGADYAMLFFTKMQVEHAPAINMLPEVYADGDSTGWEWDGTAHASASHETASSTVYWTDPVYTTVQATKNDIGYWDYTLPDVQEDLFIGAIFGTEHCYFDGLFETGWGTITESTVIDWGDPFTAEWSVDDGWTIDRVLLDGETIADTGSYEWEAFTDEFHWISIYCTGISRTLTYAASTHGTVTGTLEQTFVYGTTVGSEVAAVPDEGYVFVEWSDGVTTPIRSDRDVLEDATLTATFAEDGTVYWMVIYTAGEGGWIEGTLEQSVLEGSCGSIVTAIPDGGYRFTAWDDGGSLPMRRELRVSEDLSIDAIFTQILFFNLTYTAGVGGTIRGAASQVVELGGNGTPVMAVPDAGYRFVKWADDPVSRTRVEFNVSGDTEVEAQFELIPAFSLEYTAGSGGSIVGDASQTVSTGRSGTRVVATPDPDYHFVAWSDAYPAQSRVECNVLDDLSVSASFASDTCELHYLTCRHGTLTGDVDQTVDVGGSGTQVTAVPISGYRFTKWSDGVLTASRTDTNVVASKYVRARFRRGVLS